MPLDFSPLPSPRGYPPRRRYRAAPVVVVAAVASQPASPAADYHGHGHHAGRAGRRDMEEPIRLYCEGRNNINFSQPIFLSKSVNGTSNEGQDRDEKHPKNGKRAKPAWGSILAC